MVLGSMIGIAWSRTTSAPLERSGDHRAAQGMWAALFIIALLIALVLELVVERGGPLWLDEAWTIAVAGQATWVDLFHQVYWDVNAPLYALLIHLWQTLFGLSDLSLRIPSLIFAVSTPLLAGLSRVEGLSSRDRLVWAAVLALWFPALSFAQEARCYALLLFLSTAQCLAFLRLLQKPETRCAVAWAGLAGLSILTHYDAIFSCTIQGVIYLLLHRMRAVRTWPAAFAFVPAFAWMAYHAPRIVEFTRPEIAWYARLRVSNLWDVLGFLAGRKGELWGLLIVCGETVALRFAWPSWRPRRGRSSQRAWFAVLSSLIAATILVAIGFLRPSFAYRYLTPDAPGLLLGVVLGVRALAGTRVWPGYVGLIASSAIVSGAVLFHGDRMAPLAYSYERASIALERANPSRIVFLWDHPVAPILHPEQLDAAGGAFFRRDGHHVRVDPVVLLPDEDPNARLLAEARPSGSVILWIYDTVVQGTRATFIPPRIAALDPAWVCRAFGRGRFGVYACARGRDLGV